MKVLSTHPLPDDLSLAIPALRVVVARDEPSQLAEIADAEVLIGGFGGEDGGRFSRLMAAARKLVWIHTSSAGVDALLGDPLRQSGATLTCAKGGVVGSLLAEHAFALLLGLTRGVCWSARQNRWDRPGYGGRTAFELAGKTLGLVGYGGTGRALAERAAAFGMSVRAVNRSGLGQPVPPTLSLWGLDRLDDLLAASDIVISSIPGTAASSGLFDAGRFAAMRRGAYFINVGRGETVVTEGLVAALESGHLGGAGLDVLDPEPFPSESPLWRMDNVVISPHIAGNSPERGERNLDLIRENLLRLSRGEALANQVDLDAGY